jgi:hypothetical protein
MADCGPRDRLDTQLLYVVNSECMLATNSQVDYSESMEQVQVVMSAKLSKLVDGLRSVLDLSDDAAPEDVLQAVAEHLGCQVDADGSIQEHLSGEMQVLWLLLDRERGPLNALLW